MSSVRDDLVAWIQQEYDMPYDETFNAVNRAIEANADDERFGQDIEDTAEMIYTRQEFWESDEKPIEKD